MDRKIAIAIDGPSAAGKSSLAKRCAKAFGLVYVDTGAIYRTVGLAAHRAGIDRKNEDAVKAILPSLDIGMRYDDAGLQRMYLNGEDVTEAIRMPEISLCASDVSAHKAVRAFLMDMQRKMAREHDVIMDGRDIGTVVLPQAQLKIFLTASAETRAKRRLLELEEKGISSTYEEVLADIRYRDEQDRNRTEAPLRKAEDAVELDTSDLNFEESFSALCGILSEKLSLEPR